MSMSSSSGYKTVSETVEAYHEVKKSKFHAFLFPCQTIEGFQDRLNEIRKVYPGANHYCYTYRIHGDVLMERYQDDGEPSGTAGMPMLNVLKGHDLVQCAAVVVRYFGGTKLGTGGLASAYSQGVIDAVQASEIVRKEEGSIYEIVVDYTYNGKLDHMIQTRALALLDTVFSTDVAYLLAVKVTEEDGILGEFLEATNGSCRIKKLRKAMGFFSDHKFFEG